MLISLKVILQNSRTVATEWARAEGGCCTSGKCQLQAPGSLTLPDLHPAALSAFNINLKIGSKRISVHIDRYQRKETSQAVLLKRSQPPLLALHYSDTNNCNTLQPSTHLDMLLQCDEIYKCLISFQSYRELWTEQQWRGFLTDSCSSPSDSQLFLFSLPPLFSPSCNLFLSSRPSFLLFRPFFFHSVVLAFVSQEHADYAFSWLALSSNPQDLPFCLKMSQF